MPDQILTRLRQSRASRMRALALFGAEGDEGGAEGGPTSDPPPPEGEAGSSSDSPGGDEGDGDDEGDSLEGLSADDLKARLAAEQAKRRKANQEAAGLRRRAKEAEEKNAEYEKSQLSDLERAQKAEADASTRAEMAEATAKNILLRTAVETAATKAGFIDPEDAVKQIDLTDIEVDLEAGSVDRRTIGQRIKSLVTAKPYLVGSTSNPGGGDGPGRIPPQPRTPEEDAKEKDTYYREQGMVARP